MAALPAMADVLGQAEACDAAGQATISSEEMMAVTIKFRDWLAKPRLLWLGRPALRQCSTPRGSGRGC